MADAKHSPPNDIAASAALFLAAVAALVVANSGLAGLYSSTLKTPIEIGIGAFALEHTVKDWIKNALMAVFFLLVGLEIKAEFKEGALADRQRAILPFAGAAGGMALPAAIYVVVAADDPAALRGWAIPCATDIAFALGVVGLLGRRVPAALKAFLLAVAVIDDLGAILIIAFFYTADIDWIALALAAAAVGVLVAMNLRGVTRIAPHLAVGAVLWIVVERSGVNPTLAGVIVALAVPMSGPGGRGGPLHALAHAITWPVTFAIMPLFAFANAGVPLFGLSLADLAAPATAGIAAGLIVGKPVGIALAVLLAVRLGIARLPEGATWTQIVGVGCIAGIGFTMSLFIGALAFDGDDAMDAVRLGVLSGSLVSALLGAALLLGAGRRAAA